MNQRLLVISIFIVLTLAVLGRTALHLSHGSALLVTDERQAIPPVPTSSAEHLEKTSLPGSRTAPPPMETSTGTNDDVLRYLPQVIATAEASPPETGSEDVHSGLPDDDLLANIRRQKEELEKKERDLALQAEAMKKAEARLAQRIEELQQLEASIQQRLNDEKNIKNKKIKRLTAVYEGMKPERAAPVISRLELATVVKVFLLMDEKKVGKILSFLPPEKAVQISQALTRQISSIQ